jgi:hypothetical protein
MNQTVNLLRQNFCRPATARGKIALSLFPLERACDQGKILSAKAPKRILHLPEFNPSGLEQTYLDEATGAELPVFAIFDLAGTHRISFEITTESLPAPANGTGLLSHIPSQKAQPFVRKMNERRSRAQVFSLISVILGILVGPVCFFTHIGSTTGVLSFFLLIVGAIGGGLLGYILGEAILDWLCPWQKLVITA